MKTDPTISPKAEKEAIKSSGRRLFFPLISGILVASFLIFLAVIFALGIELKISDLLLIGIFLLITSCVILILPLVFREAAFRCPLKIYYGYVTMWVVIFFTGAALVLGAMLPTREKSAASLLCTLNLKKLEMAMNTYAGEYGGRYPDPARWCDLLVKQFNVTPDFFVCPSAAPAMSDYAMNPNCRFDSPDDVVFLFEAKGGWNQHGGPELMAFDNHGDGKCHVLIKYGIVALIKRDEADKLNWGTVEKVVLKAGDEAPPFSLPDQNAQTISLSDFAGKKVLVYFYPKAGTPGCTKQACSVRDSAEELKKAGVVPLGISPDEPNEQLWFDKEYSLGFRLLSDTDHKTAEEYGVWSEKQLGETKVGWINRSSFLIDEKGRLIGVWYDVRPEDTVPNAMQALE